MRGFVIGLIFGVSILIASFYWIGRNNPSQLENFVSLFTDNDETVESNLNNEERNYDSSTASDSAVSISKDPDLNKSELATQDNTSLNENKIIKAFIRGQYLYKSSIQLALYPDQQKELLNIQRYGCARGENCNGVLYPGCNQPATQAGIINFNGVLTIQNQEVSKLDEWMIATGLARIETAETVKFGLIGDRTTTCFLYTDKMHNYAELAYQSYLDLNLNGKPEFPYTFEGLNQTNCIYEYSNFTCLPAAYRNNIRVTYLNQYETEIQNKGMSNILAATCTYEIIPLFPGWSAAGLGNCSIKLYFDNDTGGWRLWEFSKTDPIIKLGGQEE